MNPELKQTLDELHAQLESARELDADEREQLKQAMIEIQQSLDSSDVKSHDLAHQLAKQLERFSEAHPRLVQAAGQVADTLSQMGI